MTTKKKFLTVLGLFMALILLSGLHAFAGGKGDGGVTSTDMLAGKKLGGVASRMPDNSSRILFEGILGEKLSGYSSYTTVDETLYALRSGEVSALWFCDVTAGYLVGREDDLIILETPEPAQDRFEFGLAVKNDDEGRELCVSLNEAIAALRANGVLDTLTAGLVSGVGQKNMPGDTSGLSADGTPPDAENETKYQGGMVVNNDAAYEKADKLYIGVSGTVPPIDMVDTHGRPYGFCVEFMDEIGQLIQRRVEFVVLKNETMFSALMAGRIDAVLCYGSGRNTVDTGKEYLVTDGYYGMKKYEIVALKAQDGSGQ